MRFIPGLTDPVSGQPESKAAVVQAARFDAAWYGFAISADPMAPDCAYWARARTEAGYRAELAGTDPVENWESFARALFGLPGAAVTSLEDPARGTARLAFEDNGTLRAALFIAPEPVAVMRDYLAGSPGQAAPGVLTGRPPVGQPDPGPTLCSCFGVGVNTIVAAIETQGLMDVEAVGAALQAGTNCGSCRPEIAAILGAMTRQEAAE